MNDKKSYFDQWGSIDLTPPKTAIDHSRFSGLMRNPEYSKYLLKQLVSPSIFIEITSKCNFYCSYCNSPTSIRPKGVMEEKLFLHIASQLREITNQPVALHIDGEPTLHPKFIDFVGQLNNSGIRVSLLSNGSTLQESFHSLNMDICIYVSTSKQEFETRAKMSFEKFNEKLKGYISGWTKNNSRQNIVLKVYCPSEDAHSPEKLKDKYDWMATLIEGAGVEVGEIKYGTIDFISAKKDNGYRITASLSPIVAGGLFPETDLYKSPQFIHKNSDFGFCDSAWGRMTIFCDGSIGLCCHGLQGETIYTSPEEIWQRTLKDIWLTHPRVIAFRENMARGNLILDGCKQCLSRYPMREFYTKNNTFVPEVTLDVGESLDLKGQGVNAFIFGFSANADAHGNWWTVANVPMFGFHVASKTEGQKLPEKLVLEIDGIAFAPEELGHDQHVDVILNRVTIDRLKPVHGQMNKFKSEFSCTLLHSGGAHFSLRFTQRRSPADLGLGADRRNLGLAISRIGLSTND